MRWPVSKGDVEDRHIGRRIVSQPAPCGFVRDCCSHEKALCCKGVPDVHCDDPLVFKNQSDPVGHTITTDASG